MSRKVVGLVEVPRIDGRTIASDALSLPEGQEFVPVVWNTVRTKTPLGKASDIQLEGNELSMEIELNEEYKNVIDDIEYYSYATNLLEDEKRVISGTIREIQAFTYAGNSRVE